MVGCNYLLYSMYQEVGRKPNGPMLSLFSRIPPNLARTTLGVGGAIVASSQELLPQHCPKRCISLQNSHMEH